MAMSIRQEFCDHCKDYTPHEIFKSLVGELHRCYNCKTEVIIDVYDGKTEGNDPVSIPSD